MDKYMRGIIFGTIISGVSYALITWAYQDPNLLNWPRLSVEAVAQRQATADLYRSALESYDTNGNSILELGELDELYRILGINVGVPINQVGRSSDALLTLPRIPAERLERKLAE